MHRHNILDDKTSIRILNINLNNTIRTNFSKDSPGKVESVADLLKYLNHRIFFYIFFCLKLLVEMSLLYSIWSPIFEIFSKNLFNI